MKTRSRRFRIMLVGWILVVVSSSVTLTSLAFDRDALPLILIGGVLSLAGIFTVGWGASRPKTA